MSLSSHNVSWRVGDALIVDHVSLKVEPGSMLGILGPNGSGKSSLLRLLSGLRRPSGGSVLVDGVDLCRLSRRELGGRLAVVEQEVSTDADLTVSEVVALGRTPHRNAWGGVREGDAPVVRKALARTGLTAFADRRWQSLSSGERQRTQIARALAQEPTELLLDEPTNHLDIAHQLALLELVQTLPVTSLVALHDLNLAASYCDQLVVMTGGRVVAGGRPDEVLTEELIARVYGVRALVERHASRPHIRFLGPAEQPEAEAAPTTSAAPLRA